MGKCFFHIYIIQKIFRTFAKIIYIKIMSKKIYIQDWLLLKPYKKQSATDSYYLKLSNDVKTMLMLGKELFDKVNMNEDDINLLACFLTSYFEDLASETNIWNTFVRKHKQLYQKHLPFFDLEDYCEEEINVEDITFLIWYFVNTLQNQTLIFPYNSVFRIMADMIMVVFEERWEYAPKNEHLLSFYQIDANETNFYVVRKFIDRILFDTYLFYSDTKMQLVEGIYEIKEGVEDEDKIPAMLNENRDNLTHNACTQLLALTGKEWAAEILGSTHPLYNDILSISKKASGWFFYKGQDETDVFLEHIASSMKFNMTKKSYDHSANLKTDDLLYIGIVKWKDEWWFSGIQCQTPFNPDLILDEKNSIESRSKVSFLYQQSDKIEEMLGEQLASFLKFNKGSQIAFMPSSKLEDFMQKYIEFHNKSLKLSKKEIEESEKRQRKDGFFGGEKPLSFDLTETGKTAIVFFNPKGGCEILFDIHSAFPLPNNPYFKEEQSKNHLMDLLAGETASTELVLFCIDNCKSKIPFFNQETGKRLLEDMDFMLRFWKSENYFRTPSITLTGTMD